MPKFNNAQLNPYRHRLWVEGKCIDFYRVLTNGSAGNLTAGQNLNHVSANGNPKDFEGTLANPTRAQKNQIVLHCTAGNSGAEATVNWWNNAASPTGGAQYVLERTAVAPATRPPLEAGADRNDANLVDAVLIMPEDSIPYHGGLVNQCSIGIEMSNIGWGWYLTNAANEPRMSPPQPCNPQSACPQRENINSAANPVWRCNCRRPDDHNRWIHLQSPLGGYNDYQAYEDAQYTTLIYLLRHLCIAHRIPRNFLGNTTEEVFRLWAFTGVQRAQRLQRSTAIQFRGILHHRNVHANKQCPGVVHRNRLFRGIIDEWWLPIDPFGAPRPYYSGPFANPVFQAGTPTRPALFRWNAVGADGAIGVEACTFRDANIDAISESKSYYDLDHTEHYYRLGETRHGGLFPVGTSRIWHGGTHFHPAEANPAVYAAASGVIIAARLSSNEDTDRDSSFGSQRFVLIRHYVHMQTTPEQGGRGERIDYDAVPTRVFSLYMHLGAIADLANSNERNPPWLNLWRRTHANTDLGVDPQTDKGRVFCPDIGVAVGDILGEAGMYGGRRCLHFEIFTHRDEEFTTAPWDNPQLRCDDSNDTDAICDAAALDQFLVDINGDGLDIIDILRAAPSLRNAKTLNKSEWSLQSADALSPVVPDAAQRDRLWQHIQKLTWWDDLLQVVRNDQTLATALSTAGVSLENQLGADGIVWHYHPVTFMNHINSLIHAENRELSESEYTATNVEVDVAFFITSFIRFQNNAWTQVAADNEPVRPYEVANQANYGFHFQRREVACAVCRAGGVNPLQTHFSLALLDVLEKIRMHFGNPLGVSLTYLCAQHSNNLAACCLNSPDRAALHAEGKAVDFAPGQRTDAQCRQVFNSSQYVIAQVFSPAGLARGGTVSQDCLPDNCNGAMLQAHPASAHAKLSANPQQALSAAEVAAFSIHLELTPEQIQLAPQDNSLLPVRLRVRFISISVLDDSDFFGRAEWSLNARINDQPFGPFSKSVATGETITLPVSWEAQVSLEPSAGQTLSISLHGVDSDLLSDDDLGVAQATYDGNSTPSRWGIGRQTLRSATGNYTGVVEIESLNDDVTSI